MDNLNSLKKTFTKDNYFKYGRKFALVFNVLFVIISVALFIAGLVVRFGTQATNSTTLQKIKDSARNTFGVSLSPDNFRPITDSFYHAFGIALILIGLFTVPCGVLGFYSVNRKNKKALVAYVIIVGCLLLIQVIMSYNIITSPDTVQKWMKPYLQEKLNEYNGLDQTDQVSLGWNYLMQEYQCCGIDSASDFQSSAFYARTGCYYYYYYGYNAVPGCCKTLPVSNSYYYCSSYQVYCGAYTYDSNYWKQGCVQALQNAYYSSNIGVIWAMTGMGMIVQIFLIAFAVTLIKSTSCKIEPSASSATSENETWTAGNHAVTGEHNQLPLAATNLGPQPLASRMQQPRAVTVTVPPQHSSDFDQVPPTRTPPAAAAPQQLQPELRATATRQHSFYPAEPYFPGSVMIVPTSIDYGQMMRQNSYFPMAHPTTHTQLPPQTPTTQPAPVDQPIYVQTPAIMQPENLQTMTVTEVAEEEN